ncbi:MAG TPA: formylglycine-generating enzyme family protein [Novosphingobium sp.]|nr:formylglycine-generating enzyme family protein [Novosphingobium sp.]
MPLKTILAGLGLILASTANGNAAERTTPPGQLPSDPGAKFRECRNCPEMVVMPAGSFMMGSPDAEVGRFKNEGPEHRVAIQRPFAIGAYDITLGEYRRFVRATRRAAPDSCRVYDVSFADNDLVRVRGKNWARPNFRQADNHPVVCVTWDDAQAYIDWLNGQVRRPSDAWVGVGPYRLPTEAEWEYAARAGTSTPYYWGTEIRRSEVNYGPDEPRFAPVAKAEDRWEYTSPVGAFPPNPFGLYDMVGNVWQFTQDCWHDSYAGAPGDGAARTDGKCDERVVRGGSWFKPPSGERSAKRGQGKVVDLKGNHEIGFRVARELTAQ